MFFINLMLLAQLTDFTSDSARMDTLPQADTLNPADTLTAIELQEKPYYIQDASGESRDSLNSCFTLLRELLVIATKKGWAGDFTFDRLATRFSKVQDFPQYCSVLFKLTGGGKAVYVSYIHNSGLVPTIALINKQEAGILIFQYATSKGETIAWATPIPSAGK